MSKEETVSHVGIPHILSYVAEQPWALRPVTLALAKAILLRKHLGGRLAPQEIEAAVGPRSERARDRFYDPDSDEFFAPRWDGEGEFLGCRSETTGKPMRRDATVVAVLGVLGLISQRASQIDDISGPGGTSIERLTARFRSALGDPAVKAIVLDVDSPGGGVYGVPELADEIRRSRGQKPIVAVANSLAASAAYWLASAAGELVVTPSGELGSVGVYAAHEDISKMLEGEGVTISLIYEGKYKVEGNPFEPLSEEARVEIQRNVKRYYDMFVRDLAKGRGVPVDAVRKDFGEGRVVGAGDAVERKMADRVDTLDETVRRVGSQRAPAAIGPGQQRVAAGAPASAEAEWAAARARARAL